MSFLNQVAYLVLAKATALAIAFVVILAIVFAIGYLIERKRGS